MAGGGFPVKTRTPAFVTKSVAYGQPTRGIVARSSASTRSCSRNYQPAIYRQEKRQPGVPRLPDLFALLGRLPIALLFAQRLDAGPRLLAAVIERADAGLDRVVQVVRRIVVTRAIA